MGCQRCVHARPPKNVRRKKHGGQRPRTPLSPPPKAKKQKKAMAPRLAVLTETAGGDDAAHLDAAARQVVASAGLVKPVSDMWLTAKHKPSAAEMKEQLKNLHRRQAPSTLAQAKQKMRTATKKVTAAGKKWQECPSVALPSQTHDYQAMVEDGQGSKVWRLALQHGARVPQPFLTGGLTGVNPLFSLSAVREFLVLQKKGGAWLAGSAPPQSAVEGFSSSTGWTPRLTDVLQAEAVAFVDALCPEGADREDPPHWVSQLLDGDLLVAKGFWR